MTSSSRLSFSAAAAAASRSGHSRGERSELARVGNRGLGRRHARDREPERGAADVIESRFVEEADRLRVPAMLTADAELEIWTLPSTPVNGDSHQLSHTRFVDR